MENVEATETDRVTFLGIAFRSDGHLVWFLLSMILMGIVIAIRLHPAGWTKFAGECITWFHVCGSGIAIQRTKWGRINGVIYSRDCIWFNALMAVVDILILHAATV